MYWVFVNLCSQIRSLDMKQAPPVVVMKKELDLGDDGHDGESTSNGENGLGMPLLRDPYAMHHSRPGASATLQRIPGHHSSSSAYSAAGIARAQSQQQLGLTTMAQVRRRMSLRGMRIGHEKICFIKNITESFETFLKNKSKTQIFSSKIQGRYIYTFQFLIFTF